MKFEIEKFNACKESIVFRKNYPDFKTAWENCPRGDWMLWIAKKLNVDLLKLTTAKALCANTVRNLMRDERSTKAIDVAILFGQGKASREELDAAAADAAAYTAYTAYTADAAAAAAYAAADAADAAAAAAYAAADAAYAVADAAAAAAYAVADAAYAVAAADAAYAAADAAYAAADADAKRKNQQETADICRRILTEDVLAAINNL